MTVPPFGESVPPAMNINDLPIWVAGATGLPPLNDSGHLAWVGQFSGPAETSANPRRLSHFLRHIGARR